MKRGTVLAVVLVCGLRSFAQTATADPKLQKRDAEAATAKPPKPHELSTLPPEASGEYLLDEEGSVIQITLDAGRLSGYVTKMGDDQSDRGTPLTFFFDQADARGDSLSFTTKKVHGIWFSFEGTIVRGDVRLSEAENGYFRLKGGWTTHNDARNSQTRSHVNLESTPRKD
jgi:hypothetical protein